MASWKVAGTGSRYSWPDEPTDSELRPFYGRLLRAVSDAGLRNGKWRLCECAGWPRNDSYRQLVSWCWSASDARHLVVVDLSDAPAQARVRLPWADSAEGTWNLTERLTGRRFRRAGDERVGAGLYVALDPWASNFLALAP